MQTTIVLDNVYNVQLVAALVLQEHYHLAHRVQKIIISKMDKDVFWVVIPINIRCKPNVITLAKIANPHVVLVMEET